LKTKFLAKVFEKLLRTLIEFCLSRDNMIHNLEKIKNFFYEKKKTKNFGNTEKQKNFAMKVEGKKKSYESRELIPRRKKINLL